MKKEKSIQNLCCLPSVWLFESFWMVFSQMEVILNSVQEASPIIPVCRSMNGQNPEINGVCNNLTCNLLLLLICKKMICLLSKSWGGLLVV